MATSNLKSSLITIPIPPNFSFTECLWFLNRNYDDCLHSIKPGELMKAVAIDGERYLLRITEVKRSIQVEILDGNTGKVSQQKLRDYVTGWFDMERKLDDFYAMLLKDKALAYMPVDFNGLRLVGIPDMFEALCWSIIGQQINLTFAYTLKRRLVERYGTAIEWEGEKHYIFPHYAVLAELDIDELRKMQFSGRKAEYIKIVAQEFATGRLSLGKVIEQPTLEEKQKLLTGIKGIGVWTANYVLMKCLREPGSIPYGDIGLLNALASHNIIKERTEVAKMDRLFKKYRGWESYLVFYLWRSLAVKELQGK